MVVKKQVRQKGKTTPLKVPCNAGHRSRGWREEDFDERVLHRGAKVEFEHTRDPEVAERIAMDHLVEGKNYYELLEEMEKKLVPYKHLRPKPIVSKKCMPKSTRYNSLGSVEPKSGKERKKVR